MAQRTETYLVDDLDGSEADETVQFGLDGRSYEADLSDGNARALRDALAPYVEKARKTGGAKRRASATTRPSNGATTSTEDRIRNRAIRTWAREQGMEVSERGRIPDEVSEAYREQHPDAA